MFAAALATFFLAQTPNDPATLNQAMIFIGGLTAVAVIGNQVMGAMLNFRKLKGSDLTSDGRYASKAEHDALRDEVVGIKSEMAGLARTITSEFNGLHRAIGRLEGKIDTQPKG